VGRQFTTNFDIVAGDEVLDDVENSRSRRTSSTGPARGNTGMETSTTTTSRIQQSIALLEDSDDDDDLLSKVF
jgi:hypothetical protein